MTLTPIIKSHIKNLLKEKIKANRTRVIEINAELKVHRYYLKIIK